MYLYKVTPNTPISAPVYYVGASGFDEAARIVQARETRDGGRNGGIDLIEVVGQFGPNEDENLLMSDEALAVLTGAAA